MGFSNNMRSFNILSLLKLIISKSVLIFNKSDLIHKSSSKNSKLNLEV